MKNRWLRPLVAFLFVVQIASAQTNTAILRGTVSDPSGARVSDARILLEDVNQSARREVTTDAEGAFVFTTLNPRTYTITVSKDGFQSWRGDSIVLNGADVKDVTVTLALGRTEEQVTVTAPVTDVTTSVGTNIDRDLVERLPLNGRTFQALIAMP